MNEAPDNKAEELRRRLDKEAKVSGYNLNPDSDMTSTICGGLAKNEGRYGYMSCPCRLASGKREEDKDIICPCDYRDADLAEYGSCYCALYVSAEIVSGKKKAVPAPERRPLLEQRLKTAMESKPSPGVKSAVRHTAPADNLPAKDVVAGEHGAITPPPDHLPEADFSEKRPALGWRSGGGVKVWRCKVCGYLCAKETPPAKCPICKADKDRFEEFPNPPIREDLGPQGLM